MKKILEKLKKCDKIVGMKEKNKNLPLLSEHSAFEKIKTYIYYAKIPQKYTEERVYPLARQKDIDGTTNQKVKEQKYFVWKLLSLSLFHIFGMDMKQFNIRKTASGKWVCKDIYFSLTHSKKVVAVAISNKPVGIDLQAIVSVKSGLENKILTADEKAEYNKLLVEEKQHYLITKWAQKESVFKMQNKLSFKPSSIETSKYSFITHSFTVGETDFILSASGKDLTGARVVEKQI